MSRRVCNNITTGGGATFTSGGGIHVAGHFLSNEGVEVHVMKTVPTTTEGLSRVSWGTRRTRTHRNTCHGTAKTWKGKRTIQSHHHFLIPILSNFCWMCSVLRYLAKLWLLWTAAGPSLQSCLSLWEGGGLRLGAGHETSAEVELCHTGNWWDLHV